MWKYAVLVKSLGIYMRLLSLIWIRLTCLSLTMEVALTVNTVPVENLSINKIATYSTKEHNMDLNGPSEMIGQILDEVMIMDGQDSVNKGLVHSLVWKASNVMILTDNSVAWTLMSEGAKKLMVID